MPQNSMTTAYDNILLTNTKDSNLMKTPGALYWSSITKDSLNTGRLSLYWND